MKLFYAKGACSLAPHIVLEELGAPFELVAINPAEPRPAEMLAANPQGSVPTLVTDDKQGLAECAVILQYLADSKPESNLAPKAGTWARVKLQETLNFIATELHKGVGPLMTLKRNPIDPKSQETLVAAFTERLSSRLSLIAKRLESKSYVMGDNFTVADAYLFNVMLWMPNQNIDIAKWPSLKSFSERMRARPSVQRTMKAEGLI